MTASSEREANRSVRNLLIALAIFVVGGVVAVVAGGDDAEDAAVPGPPDDGSVSDYVEARQAALADADGVHRAVVSFREYLGDDAASEAVGRRVEAWLVAAPGGAPDATDDVDRWREGTAEAARAEAAEFGSLIPTVEDPDFARQYAHDRDRALRVAESLEAGRPVVFAVVVRGPAGALRDLATHDKVRLVDVLDGGGAPPRGLRPEERRVVGQPPERP